MGKEEIIKELIAKRQEKNVAIEERKELNETIKSCIEVEDKLIRMLREENEK